MSFTLWVKIKRFWMRHGVSSWRHCQCPWRGGGWGNLRASLLSRLVTCKRPREFPWGCCLRLTGAGDYLNDLVVVRRLLSEWEQFWTASSLRCLIERRRLGTEPKFCQQAWQVTSHLTSPRTTENKADFSTLYNLLQDFTGKEVGVKVSLTSNK